MPKTTDTPKKPRFRLEVREGKIPIGHVRVIRATEDMIWLFADTSAKYPVDDGMGGSDTSLSVYITSDKRTIGARRVKDSTIITVHGIDDSWRLGGVTMGRYSAQIVLVKRPKREGCQGVRLDNWYKK